MDEDGVIQIDSKLLRLASGNFDIKTIRSLNLSNLGINKIENLDSLRSLEILNLSFNKITKIENLNNLTNLKCLDLQGNEITSLKGLRNLYKLRVLILRDNKISDIEEVKFLKNSTNLRIINLKGNEICKNPGLYDSIKELFPKIIKYNMQEVKDYEFSVKHKDLELEKIQISHNDFQYEEKEFYFLLDEVKRKVASII